MMAGAGMIFLFRRIIREPMIKILIRRSLANNLRTNT